MKKIIILALFTVFVGLLSGCQNNKTQPTQTIKEPSQEKILEKQTPLINIGTEDEEVIDIKNNEIETMEDVSAEIQNPEVIEETSEAVNNQDDIKEIQESLQQLEKNIENIQQNEAVLDFDEEPLYEIE